MALAKKILSFLKNLDLEVELPPGIEVMNPFRNEATFDLCRNSTENIIAIINHVI